MNRSPMRTGIIITAVVAVLLAAQSAYANNPPTGLPDSHVIVTTSAKTYAFSTTTHYWSIVGVATTSDYDLGLYQGNVLLGTSAYGTGLTDFIAINGNLRPPGAYTVAVTHYSGTDPYYIEQRQGATISALPVPDNDGVTGPDDPDLQFAWVHSQDVISVSDMYLTAGQQIWVNVADSGQYFYLLESNPADPATFIRTRLQASTIANTSGAQGCTLYTANYTGWHGIVEVNQNLPWDSDPQSGLANAMDAFDPARPHTCPQRNLPAPTPPGP